MNNLKKTSEIVDNWYQSYYFWQNALNANSILNSNLSHHQSHDQRLLHNHSNQQTTNNVPVVGLQRIILRTELPVYKVPSMWKRFLAELIDAFYIQLVKLIIVLVLINYTSLVNEDSFKIFDFVEDILSEENISNIRLPFELLLLEFVYVLISVLFESFCLYKKGFTPGKYLFKLKIVSCNQINELLVPGHIHVVPGGSLNLKSIFLRTFLKNFSIIFLFPTILFFLLPAFIDNYGQTSYDKVSESIVVQAI